MPLRLFSLPMGSCSGVTARPKALVSDSSTRVASARSRSMRLTTIMRGRLIVIAVFPDALGNDFDAGDAVHHDERGVHHRQHHLGLVDEHVEAGSVEQIDLDLASVLPHSTKARPVEMDILRAISSSS